MQELFTHIWVKRESLVFCGPLPAYLYTAVRNKMLDYIKFNNNYQRHLASLNKFIKEDNHVLTTLIIT